MAEIILHHYPVSHYAEKVRRILTYKKVPWRSVEQPIIMPKPDLTPLTGGYRRIPVLQIGADVYCDSACVVRRIEQLFPEPPVIFPELAHLSTLIEDWADHRFMWHLLLPGFYDLKDALPPTLMDDRALMAPHLTKENFLAGAPQAFSQGLVSMRWLDGMLADRPFLLGDKFSLADAACYFVLFFLSHVPQLFEPAIARYPRLGEWFKRIQAFGPVQSTEMSAAEAFAVARKSEPKDIDGGLTEGLQGLAFSESFKPGENVGIVADDYGTEEVMGKLVRVTHDQITVLRQDSDLGAIAVHFPRLGYRLIRR